MQCEVLNQSSACANSDEKTRKVRLQLSPYRVSWVFVPVDFC